MSVFRNQLAAVSFGVFVAASVARGQAAAETPALDPPAAEADRASSEVPSTEATAEGAPAESGPDEAAPEGGAPSPSPLAVDATEGPAPLMPEAGSQKRLLVLDFRGDRVHADDRAALRTLVTDSFLRQSDLEVTTADDIRQLVELEAERQALNCDVASCLGEIAGAYGVRYVVLGQVEKLGSRFVLTITLFDSFDLKPVGKQTVQEEDLGRFGAVLDEPVAALLASLAKDADVQIVAATKATVDAEAEDDAAISSPLFIGGGVAVVGGVALAALSAVAIGIGEVGLSQKQVPASAKLGMYIGGWAGLAGIVISGAVIIGGGVAIVIPFLTE